MDACEYAHGHPQEFLWGEERAPKSPPPHPKNQETPQHREKYPL